MTGILLFVGDVLIAATAPILAATGVVPWVVAVPCSAMTATAGFFVGRALWEDWA